MRDVVRAEFLPFYREFELSFERGESVPTRCSAECPLELFEIVLIKLSLHSVLERC